MALKNMKIVQMRGGLVNDYHQVRNVPSNRLESRFSQFQIHDLENSELISLNSQPIWSLYL